MAFVLDTSVAMAWCFEDETTPFTEAVLDALSATEAVVPAIWPLEIANVLIVAERRQRITEAQTLRFSQLVQALPIQVDEEAMTSAFGVVLAFSRECALSAYDAAYIELAARLGLPLATLDQRLTAAAKRVGVRLLE